jgi:hypothetical protein
VDHHIPAAPASAQLGLEAVECGFPFALFKPKGPAMINAGKCPKCEKTISSVNVEHVDIKQGFSGPQWHGASYTCPYCHAVLSVEIDPIALKTDIVQELFERLRQGK